MSQWHSQELKEIMRSSSANPETGLTDQEAAQRLDKYGMNRLIEERDIRFFGILKEEVTEPMILLLIAVGVLYSVWGSLTDSLTIIAIISVLVLVEVWNEYRAKRSIAALKKLASPTATVLRNGQSQEVQNAMLVPGDILLLKPGQRVPADARLLDSFGLEVDEASLSGESFPVTKDANAVLPRDATIPEELPIIVTMVLGVGAYSLSRKNALVKRLRAAETLGSVTIIATDKTGTITENKMKTASLYFDGKIVRNQNFKENEKEALKTALLASDAVRDLTNNTVLGNPMAQAILENIRENGIDAQKLPQNWVLKDELSFDNKRKLASYVYQYGNSLIVLSSGAPENVLANSTKLFTKSEEVELADETRTEVANAISEMAKAGERLLAFGYHRALPAAKLEKENLERNLVFVGIVGFIDPPRAEVEGAIRTCREAGIKVIMVTGDHPETAKAVAAQVGINSAKVLPGNEISKMNDEQVKSALKETFIFARVTPEEKLRLVRL